MTPQRYVNVHCCRQKPTARASGAVGVGGVRSSCTRSLTLSRVSDAWHSVRTAGDSRRRACGKLRKRLIQTHNSVSEESLADWPYFAGSRQRLVLSAVSEFFKDCVDLVGPAGPQHTGPACHRDRGRCHVAAGLGTELGLPSSLQHTTKLPRHSESCFCCCEPHPIGGVVLVLQHLQEVQCCQSHMT